jgi:hypothetical protein
MLMAEISKKFGEDWAQMKPAKLQSLIANTSKGFANTDWFSAKVGIKQHTYGPGESDRQWIYFARDEFPDAIDPAADVKEKTNREYVARIEELITKGYFKQQVTITKKARWFD